MTVAAGSGHRLYGFHAGAARREMRRYARYVLRRHEPDEVISGGALGWDQALGWAAVDLMIPLTLCLPFPGMEGRWQPDQQAEFKALVNRAARIEIVCDSFSTEAYQDRNVWMVDHADYVLGLWDGRHGGGTFNCLRYASERGVRVFQLWQEWTDWMNHASERRGTRSRG